LNFGFMKGRWVTKGGGYETNAGGRPDAGPLTAIGSVLWASGAN